MIDAQLQAEAFVMKRALHWRCVVAAEAARWADTWIARLDQPPPSLLDVSFASRWPEPDVAALLEPLTQGVADSALIPESLGLLAATLEKHPERLEFVCAALWDLSLTRGLPSDVNEQAGAAKFRLEDARQGVYDTVEEVAADVVRALHPYRDRFAAA
jgi:hypothetical protein